MLWVLISASAWSFYWVPTTNVFIQNKNVNLLSGAFVSSKYGVGQGQGDDDLVSFNII